MPVPITRQALRLGLGVAVEVEKPGLSDRRRFAEHLRIPW